MIFTLLMTVILFVARVFGEPVIRHYAPDHVDRIERLLTIALIIALAIVIDRLGRRFYWEGHVKKRRGRETPRLVQDLVTILIIAISVAVALWWQEGLTITGIAATSIGVAAAIGVALQPDIQDVFSGLSMNYEDTCAIGDWVTIELQSQPSIVGCVSGLSWRSTFLTLEDGRRASIPNHIFTTNPVMNHSRPPGPKKLDVQIKIDVRVPSERVVDMLLGEAFKAVRKHGLAREPAPEVLMIEIGSDAAIYEVRFWYYPNQITIVPAKSIMLLALQSVLVQNELPTPVTQIEMVPAPNLEFVLGKGEIHDALCHAALFRNALNDAQRETLASNCKPLELARGTVLMRQGDAASSMYIVLEGAISVTIDTPSGKQEVAISATGDVVGEMSLMTGAARTATVTALTQLRVLEVSKPAIADLLKASPELFERFSRVLAQRQLENMAAANRKQDVQAVEVDILAKMKDFFSRTFRRSEAPTLSAVQSE
ncbi:MAG TPA: mechanosensitive ion channel family protein [Rhizomicrobium sp.]|jgi:CRP-like cAMP-binding protein/small-conductance mechanosensitive channel